MYCYLKDALTEVRGKILFLGDSITDDGRYISFLESWLRLYAPKSGISVANLGVSSETVSGLSEPAHPFPRPCLRNRLEQALAQIPPDWVVLCYGINDGIYYPFGEERFAAYRQGYEETISKIRAQCPLCKIVVMTPPPFDPISFEASGNKLSGEGAEEYSYMGAFDGYNQVMALYSKWIREELREKVELVIDLQEPLSADIKQNREKDSCYQSGDGIHPNLHGHWVMARTILETMFGVAAFSGETSLGRDNFALFQLIHKRQTLAHRQLKDDVGHDNPNKGERLKPEEFRKTLLALDKEIDAAILDSEVVKPLVTLWNGFQKQTFYFEGFEVTVAVPEQVAEGRPWIWRTEFFGAFPSADLAMLKKGWHIVHIGISHLFGAPLAVALMDRFQNYIVERFHFREKCVLFGFSRGGLYALHYAAAHEEAVSALYLDAPVVDLASWPGGMGNAVGSGWDWERAQKAFSMTGCPKEEFTQLYQKLFSKLCEAKLPLILVAGDSDEVVPFEENGRLLVEAYEKAGLSVTCILKEGVGHHPHSLENPTPIVEFLEQFS